MFDLQGHCARVETQRHPPNGEAATRKIGGVGGFIYDGWRKTDFGRATVPRAIQYAAGVVGADQLALGSDFDGATTMPFDVTGIPLITDALRKDGLPEGEIRLIMGGNIVRVLPQILPEQ